MKTLRIKMHIKGKQKNNCHGGKHGLQSNINIWVKLEYIVQNDVT